MENEQNEAQQTEAEELASVLAGYSARGTTPPAETVTEAAPEVVEAPVIESVPAEPSVSEKLEALKAEVRAMKESGDSKAVRKLHGEIGNINRTIQQMQSAHKSEAPATDEVAEAIQAAESIANDFPEIGAPMVRALKAIASRAPQAVAQDIDIDERVSAKVIQIRQQDAIEALAEEHPDYQTVRETPEYRAWLSRKTPEFQDHFTSTWNPAVVSRGLTEFKESLVIKTKKQSRLAAAVTPQGVPAPAGPSTIPDDEGFQRGYGRKRHM